MIDQVDPYAGFRQPAVEKRFLRYLQDHFGDVTDLPNLCETMWRAGAEEAIQAMVEFSDLMPSLARMGQRVQRIHDLLELMRMRNEEEGLP